MAENRSARMSAILTGETVCNPDHAGMEFTSSTYGRWSLPRMMSTPQNDAPKTLRQILVVVNGVMEQARTD